MKNLIIISLLFVLGFSQCTKEKINLPIRNISTDVSDRINDIYFLDQKIGIAIGGSRYDNGYILRTEDGGKNWERLTNSAVNFNEEGELQTLNSIDFYNDSIGQIVGHGGKILRTIDGGKTWTAILNGSWESFYDVHMFSPNKTMILSAGAYATGSIFTSNTLWYNLDRQDVKFAPRDLFFIDNNIGFLAGYGMMQKTTDGGKTWSVLDVKTDYFFNIDFPSSNVGYACGWEGGLYKTTNQGQTWNTINPTNKVFSKRHHYENISFVDESTGIVCGYKGGILYTHDGGKTWKTIETNTKVDFHAIHFLNPTKAFVGGENGTFLEISFP